MKKRGRRRTNLVSALSGVATPVYAVDHRRRVVFFNNGCEVDTGFVADDVLGRTCEYRSDGESDVERLVNALCPPPAVFDGEDATEPIFLPRRGERNVARQLVLHPLREDDGTVPLVIGLIRELPPGRTPDARTPGTVRFHAELASARAALRRRYGRDTIVGRGPAMRRVLEQIDLAVASEGPLLFVGERGSGRTHAARVVHVASQKPVRQFVPLDCRTLSPFELKRTLKRLLGEVEPAAGLQPGTLLLQNVEGLPRDLQEMIVAAYETDVVRPRPRLMATTTPGSVPGGGDDVYLAEFAYLVTPFRIELPRLADREDDLELLATGFLEETNRGADRQRSGFEAAVWDEFRRYHWPGNVGELRATVHAACDVAEGDVIGTADLPFGFRAGVEARVIGPVRRGKPCELDPLLERVEMEQIRLALTEARFNKSRAAELLGITRARLYRRMQQLGLGESTVPEASENGSPPQTEAEPGASASGESPPQ